MGGELVRNVSDPTLTVFAPAHPNGTAMVVCPGGGFEFLSWNNEGTAVAEWLNQRGVTAFVLKYRVADTGPTSEDFQRAIGEMFHELTVDFKGYAAKVTPTAALAAKDGRRAIEIVRSGAAKWGVDPKRIGIIGFSAGASVALDATTQHTAEGRPDFTASIYGPDLRGAPVPPDAGPIFIVCAADDPIVPPSNSVTVNQAWKNGGHSAELHVFDKGGHGFGMHPRGMPVDHWIDLFGYWLQAQGLLK